jgi:two-component system, NtrC family, sensor kinase
MSLRTRIVLVLLAMVATYVVVDHTLQRRVLEPRFAELDREQAVANMERNLQLIRAESANVESRARDLAGSAAVRERLSNPNAPEIDVAGILGSTLDFVCVVRPDGSVVDYLALDRTAEARESEAAADDDSSRPISLDRFPSDQIDPRTAWLHHVRESTKGVESIDESPAGFTNTNDRAIYVASEPVANLAGETVGRVLLGRFFDERLLDELGRRLGQELVAWPLWTKSGADLDPELLEDATAGVRPATKARSDDEMVSYAVINDYQQLPLLVVETTVPRPIRAQGSLTIRYALFSTLGAGMLLLLGLLHLLDRLVLKPVARVTDHAKLIGADDRTTARLESDRKDELGVLAREFDSMMDKLAESRAAVVKAAHSAGMSEIATGILHNVGNVLNSVSIGSQLVDETVRKSRVGQLEKLVDLLAEREQDLDTFIKEDPRGAKLVPFLKAMRTQLVEENLTVRTEQSKVLEGIAHIAELVASQQAYAIRSTLKESTDVRDVASKALELTKSAGSLQSEIDMDIDFGDLPKIELDPNKLLEILVNLIQNARQAMQGGDSGTRPHLSVATRIEGDKAIVEVTDNGMGISKENLAKIFGHGFTTKKHGHGFGLHSAANAAVELGGRLYAESDGPGTGARFVLELPLPPPAAQAA